jgi:hypothetical protein
MEVCTRQRRAVQAGTTAEEVAGWRSGASHRFSAPLWIGWGLEWGATVFRVCTPSGVRRSRENLTRTPCRRGRVLFLAEATGRWRMQRSTVGVECVGNDEQGLWIDHWMGAAGAGGQKAAGMVGR